jgi:hypothetical protein
MARRRGRKKKLVKRKSSTLGGKKVKVKGHTRSPRGPNTGKKSVRVKGYARKRPRRGNNAS